MNIRRTIIIVSFLIVFGTLNAYAESLEAINKTNYGNEDYQLPETVVSEYYRCLNDIYCGASVEKLYHYLDMEFVQNRNVVIAMKSLLYSRKYMEQFGQVIDKSNTPYEITFLSCKYASDDLCYVNIIMNLKKKVVYPTFLAQGEETFVLKQTVNGWKIIKHNWVGMPIFELSEEEELSYSPERIEKNLQSVIYGKRETEELSDEVLKEALNDVLLRNPTAVIVHTYNPVYGVSYAVDTAATPNPLFQYCYQVDTYGNQTPADCTDFASQCVSYGFRNGGNRSVLGSYQYTYSWYPNTSNYWANSLSWMSVVDFYNYMTYNAMLNYYLVYSNVLSSYQSGCVVQFYSTYWSHTAIVYTNGSTAYIAQHSPDNTRLLSDVLSQYTSVRYFMPVYLYSF